MNRNSRPRPDSSLRGTGAGAGAKPAGQASACCHAPWGCSQPPQSCAGGTVLLCSCLRLQQRRPRRALPGEVVSTPVRHDGAAGIVGNHLRGAQGWRRRGWPHSGMHLSRCALQLHVAALPEGKTRSAAMPMPRLPCAPQPSLRPHLSLRPHDDQARNAHHRESAAQALLHRVLLKRQRQPGHAAEILLSGGWRQGVRGVGMGAWGRSGRSVTLELPLQRSLLPAHTPTAPQTAAGCGPRRRRAPQSPAAGCGPLGTSRPAWA